MTGKVTTGEWQPASFDAIDLTQIPDWTSLVDGKETKQLPAVDLKYGDKSITVEVTFTKTENKEATRTIHYQVAEGQAAKDDTVQTVAFQRTVSTDENGKTNYGALTPAQPKTAKTIAPVSQKTNKENKQESAKLVKTAAKNSTDKANKSEKQALPQTGEKKSEFGLIGLALVSAAALIGLSVDRERN